MVDTYLQSKILELGAKWCSDFELKRLAARVNGAKTQNEIDGPKPWRK